MPAGGYSRPVLQSQHAVRDAQQSADISEERHRAVYQAVATRLRLLSRVRQKPKIYLLRST